MDKMKTANDVREKLGMKKINDNFVEEYNNHKARVEDAKGKVDMRYNTPKAEPKASEELVNKTISETEIYRRAKLAILQAQQRQVGYGIDKYPEPLNANTWSTIETIDHIIEESIDKLHYLVMLRIKLEQDVIKDNVELKTAVDEINKLVVPSIKAEDLYLGGLKTGVLNLPTHYVVGDGLKQLDKPDDRLDALAYSLKQFSPEEIDELIKTGYLPTSYRER
jgi:hypothetical protein